jgi:hypothetical protein
MFSSVVAAAAAEFLQRLEPIQQTARVRKVANK